MLLRKKNGLNFTPQDFFDSHVCNVNSLGKGKRAYLESRFACLALVCKYETNLGKD